MSGEHRWRTPYTRGSGGLAPEARLLVVIPRLETDPTDPRSVGYSKVHDDALGLLGRFAEIREMSVVVNLSVGTMNAGAHGSRSRLPGAPPIGSRARPRDRAPATSSSRRSRSSGPGSQSAPRTSRLQIHELFDPSGNTSGSIGPTKEQRVCTLGGAACLLEQR